MSNSDLEQVAFDLLGQYLASTAEARSAVVDVLVNERGIERNAAVAATQAAFERWVDVYSSDRIV